MEISGKITRLFQESDHFKSTRPFLESFSVGENECTKRYQEYVAQLAQYLIQVFRNRMAQAGWSDEYILHLQNRSNLISKCNSRSWQPWNTSALRFTDKTTQETPNWSYQTSWKRKRCVDSWSRFADSNLVFYWSFKNTHNLAYTYILSMLLDLELLSTRNCVGRPGTIKKFRGCPRINLLRSC